MNPDTPFAAMLTGYVIPFIGGVAACWFLGILAAVVTDRALKLAATLGLAMKRADVTQDYVTQVTGMPKSKLSEQLSGKQPLTVLRRILESDVIAAETDLEIEFYRLRAEQLGYRIVQNDLGALVDKLDQFLTGKKPMAKVSLRHTREEQRA